MTVLVIYIYEHVIIPFHKKKKPGALSKRNNMFDTFKMGSFENAKLERFVSKMNRSQLNLNNYLLFLKNFNFLLLTTNSILIKDPNFSKQ